MTRSLLIIAALFAAACTPPPDVPPTRFKSNPPYHQPFVDEYPPSSLETGLEEPNTGSPPPDTPAGSYPTARPGEKPNEVISPFPPHHAIDIEGFRSGQLARDPSNNQIFRVP